MPQPQPSQASRRTRILKAIRIVPMLLAAIGAGVLAYGAITYAQTPQTLGAALIGIALVAQISAVMRKR